MFNLNLIQSNNADDVSLDAIAIMAQAGNEAPAWNGRVNGDVVLEIGGWFRNWQAYQIRCTYQSTSTTVRNFGLNPSISGGINAPIPKTPISGELSAGIGADFGTSTQVVTTGSPITVLRTVCGKGWSNCIAPAPNGDPCF